MSTIGNGPQPSPVVGRALLISSDSVSVDKLTNALKRFAITAVNCDDSATATSLINTRKFEAVLVDVALGEQVVKVLEYVRVSPSNGNCVTFALVDSTRLAKLKPRSNFILQKPLSEALIDNTLKAALGSIIRDYRRYFRCPVVVSVVLHAEALAPIHCETMNVSEGGMALQTSADLKPGTRVRVQFSLSNNSKLFDFAGEICWSDKKGHVGMQFRQGSTEDEISLQSWLSSRIEERLPKPILQHFQKADCP